MKILLVSLVLILSSCAQVSLAPSEISNSAKQFSQPQQGEAAIYIFRGGLITGPSPIYFNGDCVASTGPNTFYRADLPAGETLRIGADQNYSSDDVTLELNAGVTYYIEQSKAVGYTSTTSLFTISTKQALYDDIVDSVLVETGNCTNTH